MTVLACVAGLTRPGDTIVTVDPTYGGYPIRIADWAGINITYHPFDPKRMNIKIEEAREDESYRRRQDPEGAGDPPLHDDLMTASSELDKALEALIRRLHQPPDTKGIPPESDVDAKIGYALRNLGSSWDAPTQGQRSYVAAAAKLLDEVLAEINRLFDTDVERFRRQVAAAGFTLLPEAAPLAAAH